MAGKLAGRKILITGAASGMGREISRLFIAEGAKVALLDQHPIDSVKLSSGRQTWQAQCDVTDEASSTCAVDAAAKALDGLDGVVNAAGIFIASPADALTALDLTRLLSVNLIGPVNIIRAASPHLRRADCATIVNIASASAFHPFRNTAGYAASKAGLVMYTKTLALELAPSIRANTICPGTIETAMTHGILGDPERRRELEGKTALKCVGTVTQVANAALYLSSLDSAFTTGSDLVLDGGVIYR